MQIPKDDILENIIEKAKNDEGISMEDLRDGDLVTIETLNYTFELILIDAKNRVVQVKSDNPNFAFLKPVRVTGSCPHQFSSSVKLGWIMNCWCLELNLEGARLVTAHIRSVSVNGSKIFPILENATLQ